MHSIGHFAENAREIEREIVRVGVALGIDWDDAAAVGALAREAVAYHAGNVHDANLAHDAIGHARLKLFGLAALMLHTMERTALEGFELHGGTVWKTFARALWQARAAAMQHKSD